ncbi:unnamed protein product [Moneuplotes crassus]|uniref:GAF domain-containing protein n=1 Tax=Euplotes crassus TaxID=5936 RepID=A0AAD1X8U9_EUPCR|nr:unnamed protein product [Moneuplotes crassus]
MYEEENRGYLSHMIVNKEPLSIVFPEEKYKVDNNMQSYEQAQSKITKKTFKPCFKDYKSVANGIQVKNQIACPIFNPNYEKDQNQSTLGHSQKEDSLQKRLFAVVQIEKPSINDISNNSLPFLILRTIANYLSLAITKIVEEKESVLDEERAISILHHFRDLTHLTHLPEIWERITEYIPKIFNCKRCAFFIKDNCEENKDDEKIWTITSLGEDVTRKEIKFIRGKVVYPCHVGYTGHAIQTKKPLFYLHPKLRDIGYEEPECMIEEEIDNFFQEAELECVLFYPLIDHKGKMQGVIQLSNFNHGPFSITQRQMKEIGITCELIGTSLHNLREITEIMICCTNLYDKIQGIYEKVVEKLADYLEQIEGDIIESIRNISTCVKDICDIQKYKMFKDRILLNTYAEYEVEEKRREKLKIKILRKNKNKEDTKTDATK